MKYFRSYPYMLQLLLLLLMVFTLMSAAVVFISVILTKTTSFTFAQLSGIGPNSPADMINVMAVVQGASNFLTFCVPALLFAYLATPHPASYLGMRRPGKPIHLLLAILIMLGAAPVLSALSGLIGQINFGTDVKASQKASDDMMSAFLNITSFAAFMKAFVIFAIVPGIGEELFFRGLLMRYTKKRSRNMVFPILFSAAVFAFVHTNIYGYLSIFFAGILLALLYYLTGSIWCSILGHISFNGLQITLSYMGRNNASIKAFMDSNTVPYYLFAGGLAVSCGAFYLLWKNKTPLPSTWTDDFTPAELSQKAY